MIVEVAPFITAAEFRTILTDCYIRDPQILGWVRHGKKRGSDKCYLATALHSAEEGNRIIGELNRHEYCHVPLSPHWARMSEWGYMFYLESKRSTHDQLDVLASSTLIQRIKRECPLSHHSQLDELLCTSSNQSEILLTYEDWFGRQSFSPFGTIENSNF